ncbi:MAG: SRPBCC family protein [Acidimicrobiales bacterium]
MTDPRHPLGTVRRDESGTYLQFERHLSHGPERVWRALTESDQLRHWMPCDIIGDRAPGAELVVPFWDDVAQKYQIDEPTLTGRIITWEPFTRFAWEWDDELISYDLAPNDGGTILTLVVRLGSKSPGAELVLAGYHVCLDQLCELVETDAPPPFIDADPSGYEQLYTAQLSGS